MPIAVMTTPPMRSASAEKHLRSPAVFERLCRVVAAGRASRDDAPEVESLAEPGLAGGAAQVAAMAEDLAACASLWRRESLD